MKNNGFYIGQKLLIPELDNQNEYQVTGIFPGGMGICVKIEHMQKKEVFAIKGLQTNLINDNNTYLRFIRELDIWFTASSCDGVIEAKGIVNINNLPYMVTEWADNGDLSYSFKTMTSEQKIKIFLEVIETLNQVYNNFKVIHRDLKPQNILINSKNRGLISDWGLAKIYGNEINQHSKHDLKPNNNILKTQVGSCLGTVLYMSPEQIKDASSVDCRSDIYSLGCILYELETDYPPFIGDNVEAILLSHLFIAPPKLGGFFKRTKLGLEKVVAKCLKKNPNERYQTYDEMIQDIKIQLKSRGVPQYNQPQIRYNHNYPEHARSKLHEEVNKKGQKINNELYGIVDAEGIYEEAKMLVGTNRYAECVRLLEPLGINRQMIPENSDWFYICDLLLVLALALTKTDQLAKANDIYSCLIKVNNKPAVFYVNYSMLLLSQHKYNETINVCKEGLKKYNNDPDLLGNCTSAYIFLDDPINAIKYSKQRITIQGLNVHSCHEMNNVLSLISSSLLNNDLDAWKQNMNERYFYISKGLELNSSDDYLNHAKIKFISEIDEVDCLDECTKVLSNKLTAPWLREIILGLKAIMLKEYARNKNEQVKYDVLITLQEDVKLYGNNEKISSYVRGLILQAYYFMIINFYTKNGDVKKIEILNHFYLSSPFSYNKNNEYNFPIEVAQLYKLSGDLNKALEILSHCYPQNITDWYFNRVYIAFLLENKQIDLAEKIAYQGIEKMPASEEAWDSLYFVINEKGQKTEAEKVKSKADELFKHKVEIKKTLRKLYCKE